MYRKGQKIKMTHDCSGGGFERGDVFTLTQDHERRAVFVDNDGDYRSRDKGFELVAPAFTITTGKFYRTASGAVTGRVTKGDTGFEAVVDGKVRIFDAAGGAVHGGDDIVEEWVPKVGERVRYSGKCAMYNEQELVGLEGTVTHVGTRESSVKWDREVVRGISTGGAKYHANLEPLSVAAPAQPAATLKIEAGRYYRTRDGRKVGPMEPAKYSDGWYDAATRVTSQRWEKDGTFIPGELSLLDLIAEWVDEPAAPVSAQVDAIAEEYGSGKREPRPWDRHSERAEAVNDNHPSTTFTISLNTGNMHEELDEMIAKLKKVRKLQRQIGLAA